MLDNPNSHGLWEMTSPVAPEASVLTGDQTADAVVIGGGYTGVSTALHLAEAGLRVILLEAVEIGYGGAGRNVGLVNAGMWMMPDDLVDTLGRERGEALLTLLGNGPKDVFSRVERHRIACEAVTTGTIHCGLGNDGKRELSERAEQWQRRGAAVEFLDAGKTAQMTGTRGYTSGLLDHRAGVIQPLAYVRGLAKAAADAGAVLFTGSPVVSTERQGTRWRIATKSGSLTADHVVVATNLYSDKAFNQIRREQIAMPYFNFATKPLSPEQLATILPGKQGAWDTAKVLKSFRLDAAGRLVFGSFGAFRAGAHGVHRAWAQRAIKRLFPRLGEVEFEAEWFGWIGMTDNSLPHFHRLGPNMLTICGFNGRGIAPGTVFGRLLADMVSGKMRDGDCPLPLTEPGSISFRPARELVYEAGAALLHAVN